MEYSEYCTYTKKQTYTTYVKQITSGIFTQLSLLEKELSIHMYKKLLIHCKMFFQHTNEMR